MARGSDRNPSGPATRDPRERVIQMAKEGRSIRTILRYVNRGTRRSSRTKEHQVRAWLSQSGVPAS